MNLRDLGYLLAVAEHRHFGRAAEFCHVSQPTLSGQIKKLEAQLGVTLFERNNKHVAVTAVGAEVLRHARLAVEQADAIARIARERRDPMAGPLRLGVILTLSPYLMPLVLAPLRRSLPQLRIVLSEELTDSLLARLQRHEIDAALLGTACDDPELESWPLFDEPFWVAFPRGHALAQVEEITERDLADTPLLLLTDGHCLRDQALHLCGGDPARADSSMDDLRAASLETLLNLVAADFGCTLVPALAIRGGWTTDMGILARPVKSARAKRTVSMVFRRSFPRKAALEALADVIVENLPNTVVVRGTLTHARATAALRQ